MSEPLRAPRVFTAPGRDPGPPAAPPRAHALRWALVAAAVLVLAPPVLVLALRWIPPPTSAFMLRSPVKPVHYQWVPAERIAEAARRAAVASEDQKFWDHSGFDFEAIGEALEERRARGSRRGASTITQQVAKNLFLWPGRSWLRKGVEVSFTVLLELLWPKERILEVYLNIAEFGPGVFGVEAAARRYFGHGAARLSPEQAARLVAVLPSPRKWSAAQPGPYVLSRVEWILRQAGYRPRAVPVQEPEPEPPETGPESLAIFPPDSADAPGAEDAEDAEVEPEPEAGAPSGPAPEAEEEGAAASTAPPDPDAPAPPEEAAP